MAIPRQPLHRNLVPGAGSGDPRLGLSLDIAGHYQSRTHRLHETVLQAQVLIHCVEGIGWVTLPSGHRTIQAGELFLCPAGARRAYAAAPETGWDIWWCVFQGTLADGLLQLAGLDLRQPVRPLAVEHPAAQDLRAMVNRLEIQDGREGWDASVLLYRMLAEMGRDRRQTAIAGASLAPAMDGDFSDVEAMAAACAMPRSRFVRRFRTTIGTSPWRWILEHRMAKAKELLADPDLPVKTVARRLGYADPDYFSRCFARLNGMSVRTWRRSQGLR